MAEADLREERTIMNDETIEYRLTQIEKKLDTVTDLLLQTQAQEMRISTLEKQNIDLKGEIDNIKTQKSKSIERWLTPLISTGVSILVAFIAVKIGLK